MCELFLRELHHIRKSLSNAGAFAFKECAHPQIRTSAHLLKRYSYLNSRSRSSYWWSRRYLRDHFPLIEVQLNIHSIIQHIIYRRRNNNFFLSGCWQRHSLVKPAVGCGNITYTEIEPEVDVIVKLLCRLIS